MNQQRQDGEGGGGAFSLDRAMSAVRRRLRIVIAMPIAAAVLTSAVMLWLPDRFDASAIVQIDPRKKTISNLEGVLSELKADTATVESEVEIIRSRWLIARAPLIRLADERQPLLSWFQPTVPRFATLALSDQTDWSDVSLAIESPQDLEQMRWLSQTHGTSLWHWPWEVVAAEVRRWGASRLSSDEAAA